MARRLFGLLVVLAAFPTSAVADTVIVLGSGGQWRVRDDPFLTTPPMRGHAGGATLASAPRTTVYKVLAKLYRRGAIDQATYSTDVAAWRSALRTEHRLTGTRAVELGAVIANIRRITAAGMLSASRLAPLFLTLDANRQWWTTGPLLVYGQRVELQGSQLVWEYYPGQGIELQQLANFGKADGLYTAGRSHYSQLRSLLGELGALAVKRDGGLAWEYYFSFDGGSPPWTSAMTQGTALEALTRAYKAFGDSSYLDVAHQALQVIATPSPRGDSVLTAVGRRYLLYSFAPGAAVINGFLQTLIGLYDYSRASGDQQAQQLFTAGDTEAQAEVPRYDTGAWSLYQPGQEDTLDYHELVTGFLHDLCSRTAASVYCTTAQHFDSYLRTPPALKLLTGRVKVRKPATVSFRLSKISRVGIVVLHGANTLFETSAPFPYGTHAFAVPAFRRRGTYTVHLAATDLAGNFNRIVTTLRVH